MPCEAITVEVTDYPSVQVELDTYESTIVIEPIEVTVTDETGNINVTVISEDIDVTVTIEEIEVIVSEVGLQGTSGSSTYIREFPSGTINGLNIVFTLSQEPLSASLILTVNGLVQVVGYLINNKTITFDSDAAPHVGDVLLAVYQY